MKANEIFLQSEGDEWLKRNSETLESGTDHLGHLALMYQVLKSQEEKIEKILEVGCSSGERLDFLCRAFSAQGAGVDPSASAIRVGSSRVKSENHGRLQFVRGLSNNLPFEEQSFDLIYLGFFLYLEDRETLLLSLSEADRVLKAGGFIILRDFYPEKPHRVRYEHYDGLFSYKNDYIAFFLALGHYFEIASLPINRKGVLGFESNPSHREIVSICKKKEEPYPLDSPSGG